MRDSILQSRLKTGIGWLAGSERGWLRAGYAFLALAALVVATLLLPGSNLVRAGAGE